MFVPSTLLYIYSIWMLLTLTSSFSPLLSSPFALFSPSLPLRHKRWWFNVNSNPLPSFQADVDTRSEAEDKDSEMAMLLKNLPTSHTYSLNLPCSLSSVSPGSSVQIPTDLSSQMQHLVSHLEAASQAVWLQIAKQEQSDKLTMAAYERHINSYTTWWDTYQVGVVNVDPTQVRIPAFPVTAVKATMFLEYTSTCLKVFISFALLHCACT